MNFLKCITIFFCFSSINIYGADNSNIVRKFGERTYATQINNLFYVLTKLDYSDSDSALKLDFWEIFAKKESKPIRLDEKVGSRNLSTVRDGSVYFKRAIESIYSKRDSNVSSVDLWVAFVYEPINNEGNHLRLNEVTKEYFDKLNRDKIVMVMTVSSADKIPYTTHMGIFKTTVYTFDPIEEAKGISHILHAFAGTLANDIFKKHTQEKEYMCTTPAPVMRKILVKKLQSKGYFIGSKEKFNKWKDSDMTHHKKEGSDLKEQRRKRRMKQKITEYYPDGIDNAPEPPLSIKQKEEDWSFKLKSGKVVKFKPTALNKKQHAHIVPWMTIDLEALKRLIDIKLQSD